MSFDRPAILGIVFGVLIGSVNAALQIHELRLKGQVVQPKGVSVLVPGAGTPSSRGHLTSGAPRTVVTLSATIFLTQCPSIRNSSPESWFTARL